MLLKIGELAKRTGLTVRTLHHYDAIKLLCPSGRSPAGYRLYDRNDIARLHRIQALRRLDLPLTEIAALLEGEGADLDSVIARQIAALDQQVARASALRDRLTRLREHLQGDQEPDMEYWLSTLAMMQFYDRYFTPEELEQLRRGGASVGGEFKTLKEQLRRMMKAGIPPSDEKVLALARRWIEMNVHQLAGDARLIQKMDALHRSDPDVHFVTGIDAALLDYLTRATAEYRLSLYARHVDPADLAPARERFLRHYLEWPPLFAEARELHARGADPTSPEALDLAARWIGLFTAVWGDDERVHRQVLAANEGEPELIAGLGVGDPSIQLIRASIQHLKLRKGGAQQ